MSEIPVTTAVCDGSGEEFSLLTPHLEVSLRPVVQRVSVETIEAEDEEDALAMPEQRVYLSTLAGRGVTKKFKDFDALNSWAQKYEGKTAKLEVNVEPEVEADETNDEDGEI